MSFTSKPPFSQVRVHSLHRSLIPHHTHLRSNLWVCRFGISMCRCCYHLWSCYLDLCHGYRSFGTRGFQSHHSRPCLKKIKRKTSHVLLNLSLGQKHFKVWILRFYPILLTSFQPLGLFFFFFLYLYQSTCSFFSDFSNSFFFIFFSKEEIINDHSDLGSRFWKKKIFKDLKVYVYLILNSWKRFFFAREGKIDQIFTYLQDGD